ncbi:hypothetical protein [Spirosoma litoris]
MPKKSENERKGQRYLFRENALCNKVWNQQPKEAFDEEEEKAQPANALEPKFEALIHKAKIAISGCCLLHTSGLLEGDYKDDQRIFIVKEWRIF